MPGDAGEPEEEKAEKNGTRNADIEKVATAGPSKEVAKKAVSIKKEAVRRELAFIS